MASSSKQNETEKRETSSSQDADLSARLASLDAKLTTIDTKRQETDKPRNQPDDKRAIGEGLRLSAEFVSGVVAGGLIGWVFDKLLETSPWGLICCLLLGFCAGMLNLLRAAGVVKKSSLKDDH